MARAVFGQVVLAESERTIRVEGNEYFPPESVRWQYLRPSRTRTVCFWKGVARYHDVRAEGLGVPDAAWSYPHPCPLARRIRGYVAFCDGVQIQPDSPPAHAEETTRPAPQEVPGEGRDDAAGAEGVRAVPATRIGVAAGLLAISCCVGPTVLALVGAVSAANAYAWATRLYGGYAWWFRAAGALLALGLTTLALRRRRQCSLAGARSQRGALARIAVAALATYLALYGATTALGHLAR